MQMSLRSSLKNSNILVPLKMLTQERKSVKKGTRKRSRLEYKKNTVLQLLNAFQQKSATVISLSRFNGFSLKFILATVATPLALKVLKS